MVREIEACGVEKDTMINNLIIRQETEEDYKKTELMIALFVILKTTYRK